MGSKIPQSGGVTLGPYLCFLSSYTSIEVPGEHHLWVTVRESRGTCIIPRCPRSRGSIFYLIVAWMTKPLTALHGRMSFEECHPFWTWRLGPKHLWIWAPTSVRG